MFQNIRYRLLLSYLIIFASILSIFAVGVRLMFAHSLKRQFLEKLMALGEGFAANIEKDNGHLKPETDFNLKQLLNNRQGIQWFDVRGNLIGERGDFTMKLSFASNNRVQIQQGNPKIQGVVLPIIDSETKELIGYIRVSQSLEEVEATLQKLNWGLGVGIVGSLILSGVGGIILTNQAMQPIEKSFQRLKQFTADASHELRSPLMAIQTNVAVSLKYPLGMRETDQESFEAITSAANQMTHLTENLLLLARAEKITTAKKEKVNLTIILKNLFKGYQAQAQAKNIDFKITLDEFLLMSGDPLQLERLFSNLIENALYYTPERGLVEIQGKRRGTLIEVQIKDTGIGIATEDLDKIFDRFWRADHSRSYHSGGSGLGLAIASSIALQHKGKITVSSKIGTGSCFLVVLPTF